MSTWPYPAPLDDGDAGHLVPGAGLPSAALPSATGTGVDLAAVQGTIIIYAYTWTGRPGLQNPPGWDTIPGAHGSTPQTERFRDLYGEFRNLGAEVFGLSTQDSAHQKELVERLCIPFSILSDEGLRFAGRLGLPVFVTGGVTYLKRLTMVAHDGRLVRIFYPVHPPHTHADDVLQWLRATGPV